MTMTNARNTRLVKLFKQRKQLKEKYRKAKKQLAAVQKQFEVVEHDYRDVLSVDEVWDGLAITVYGERYRCYRVIGTGRSFEYYPNARDPKYYGLRTQADYSGGELFHGAGFKKKEAMALGRRFLVTGVPPSQAEEKFDR